MKGKFLSKAVFLDAAVAMAVTGIGAVPVSAEEEYINLEEFFASAGGVKQVCLGTWHSAAITKNGDLYSWGSNISGELGDGTKNNSLVPIKIMSNATSVSLGVEHSAATTANGDLYTWGDNYYGQLGNGTTKDVLVPTKVDFFKDTETPASPKITKAVSGNGQVALNWTSVTGAKQYAVYTYVNSKWTLAGKTTALGMYVRGLTNGTKYGFAVKAYVNGAWTGITSSDIVYATPTAAKSSIIDIDPEDIELFNAVPVIA